MLHATPQSPKAGGHTMHVLLTPVRSCELRHLAYDAESLLASLPRGAVMKRWKAALRWASYAACYPPDPKARGHALHVMLTLCAALTIPTWPMTQSRC